MSATDPEVKKSIGELLMDPHFVFTILSLVLSLGVFLYYLVQLLFARDEDESAKSIQERAQVARVDRERDAARVRESRAKLDAKIAEAASRLEARKAALEAQGGSPAATDAVTTRRSKAGEPAGDAASASVPKAKAAASAEPATAPATDSAPKSGLRQRKVPATRAKRED